MAVVPLGSGRYEVVTADGDSYTATIPPGRCTCPDYRHRGARCKHLRRVAIDVAADRVPAPTERAATCAACDRRTFADRDDPDPVYCGDCTLAPGEFVVDREAGDLLAVVRTTDRRADEVVVPGTERTVAAYPGNEAYPVGDVVVTAVYPAPADPTTAGESPPRRYSFSRGRLRRIEAP